MRMISSAIALPALIKKKIEKTIIAVFTYCFSLILNAPPYDLWGYDGMMASLSNNHGRLKMLILITLAFVKFFIYFSLCQ
jgi:hypothetical protein